MSPVIILVNEFKIAFKRLLTKMSGIVGLTNSNLVGNKKDKMGLSCALRAPVASHCSAARACPPRNVY